MGRVQFTVGELLIEGVYDGAVYVLARDEQNKILWCKGGSVPSATTGYAIGCIFINTSTGVAYTNQGTTSSCSFRATFGASISASVSPSASPSRSPSVSPS